MKQFAVVTWRQERAQCGRMTNAPHRFLQAHATMAEQQLSDDSNPLHVTEPVTIRLYGFKDITLPAYLLLFLATILIVTMLIAAAREVVAPHTPIGEKLHQMAKGEPWTITLAEWVPLILGLGLAFEVVEAVVVFSAFARKIRSNNSQLPQS